LTENEEPRGKEKGGSDLRKKHRQSHMGKEKGKSSSLRKCTKGEGRWGGKKKLGPSPRRGVAAKGNRELKQTRKTARKIATRSGGEGEPRVYREKRFEDQPNRHKNAGKTYRGEVGESNGIQNSEY